MGLQSTRPDWFHNVASVSQVQSPDTKTRPNIEIYPTNQWIKTICEVPPKS